MLDISAFITEFRKTHHNATQYNINNGMCDEFADELSRRLRGSLVISTPLSGDYPGHDFVKYRGRYYDAETPMGVVDPIELPIFSKFHIKHPRLRLVTNEYSKTSKYGVSIKEWMEKYYG